jgi:LysR family transcriptional activator of nhaA
LSRHLKWFDNTGVAPEIVGENNDSALLKSFGHAGVGLFFLPTVIENEIRNQYNVKVIGRTAEVREKFYAISPERSIKHPAIVAICDSEREQIFCSEW